MLYILVPSTKTPHQNFPPEIRRQIKTKAEESPPAKEEKETPMKQFN